MRAGSCMHGPRAFPSHRDLVTWPGRAQTWSHVFDRVYCRLLVENAGLFSELEKLVPLVKRICISPGFVTLAPDLVAANGTLQRAWSRKTNPVRTSPKGVHQVSGFQAPRNHGLHDILRFLVTWSRIFGGAPC